MPAPVYDVAITGLFYSRYGTRAVVKDLHVRNEPPIESKLPGSQFHLPFRCEGIPDGARLYRGMVTLGDYRYLVAGYLEDASGSRVNQSIRSFCSVPWRGEIAVLGLGVRLTYVYRVPGPRAWANAAVALFVHKVMKCRDLNLDISTGEIPSITEPLDSPVCQSLYVLHGRGQQARIASEPVDNNDEDEDDEDHAGPSGATDDNMDTDADDASYTTADAREDDHAPMDDGEAVDGGEALMDDHDDNEGGGHYHGVIHIDLTGDEEEDPEVAVADPVRTRVHTRSRRHGHIAHDDHDDINAFTQYEIHAD